MHREMLQSLSGTPGAMVCHGDQKKIPVFTLFTSSFKLSYGHLQSKKMCIKILKGTSCQKTT